MQTCVCGARVRAMEFDNLQPRVFTMTCVAKLGSNFLEYAAAPHLDHSVLTFVFMEAQGHFSPFGIVTCTTGTPHLLSIALSHVCK